MGQRLEFQSLLQGIRGEGEAPIKTYFQPPANKLMEYPCFVYKWDDADAKFAGNRLYSFTRLYQVTYISDDPDDGVPDLIAQLPMSDFDRSFTIDHLIHRVFNVFF